METINKFVFVFVLAVIAVGITCVSADNVTEKNNRTSRYFVSNAPTSWGQAKKECLDLGQELVVILRPLEQRAIQAEVQDDDISDGFWIGGSFMNHPSCLSGNAFEEKCWSWVGKYSGPIKTNVINLMFDQSATSKPNKISRVFYKPDNFMPKLDFDHGTVMKRYICDSE